VSAVERGGHHAAQAAAVRGLSILQPIAGVPGLDLQALDNEVAMPFATGARRERLAGRKRDDLMDREMLRFAALG